MSFSEVSKYDAEIIIRNELELITDKNKRIGTTIPHWSDNIYTRIE